MGGVVLGETERLRPYRAIFFTGLTGFAGFTGFEIGPHAKAARRKEKIHYKAKESHSDRIYRIIF
jgi:hypothetical protein